MDILFKMRNLSLFVLVLSLGLCSCDEKHEDSKTNPLHDTKHVHDKEHIKEHLKDVVDVKDDSLKEEDLQFHYFKLHDDDNNNKLDGLELGNAISHYHEEEEGGQQAYTDEQLANMIDQILEEDDHDKDGYISYPEFIASQKS